MVHKEVFHERITVIKNNKKVAVVRMSECCEKFKFKKDQAKLDVGTH